MDRATLQLIAVALLGIASASRVSAAEPASKPGAPTTAADRLVGIWAYEATFGPWVRGELSVTRDGAHWRARIGELEATSSATNDGLQFSFPRNSGGFRGRLLPDGSAIEGFWLQPFGTTAERPNPTGARQAFASPLHLPRAERNAWRARVRPLEERFSLYLKIFRSEDGSLLAAFRNPQINSIGGTTQFRVSLEGATVRFDGITRPEIRHSATLASRPERLQIVWPDVGRTLDLTRIEPARASGFFPRSPGEPAYVYRRPPETGDGWNTVRARDVGLDEAALTRVVQTLSGADPAARRPSLIHSFLVARRGKLVLEEYFFGFDRDTPHDTRSAGKTFASVMLGAAMMQGVPVAPETSIYGLFGGARSFANPDPRKSAITLAHLMTHTSGLACDDNDDASPGNEGTLQTQREQPDWWKYTLDLPMAHDPGSRYAYCSANMNLMGGALTKATGVWLPELFDRTVARPLQFGHYHWNLMPTREGYLGGGAWLRPRDLLKLGQAYLDGGVWSGRRIVEESWVRRSTLEHVKISPATTGLTTEQFGDFYLEGADGYAWHLGRVRTPERAYAVYEATGNGGQVLTVVPELDLVTVFTGGNYMQGGIWLRWKDELVGAQIIPSIHLDRKPPRP